MEENSQSAAELLQPRKNLPQTIGFYSLIAGWILILLAALCFFQHQGGGLIQYRGFSIDANVLGLRLLIAGAIVYLVGRVMSIIGRQKRRA